jgi:hypothetical protein
MARTYRPFERLLYCRNDPIKMQEEPPEPHNINIENPSVAL